MVRDLVGELGVDVHRVEVRPAFEQQRRADEDVIQDLAVAVEGGAPFLVTVVVAALVAAGLRAL